MKTLQMIHYFNFVIATVFVVFYFYQIGYLLLGLLMKHRKNKTGSHQFHRYAAVISARNCHRWSDCQFKGSELSI